MAAVIAALGFSGMAGANKVNPNDTKHSGSNYILPVLSVSPARGEVSVRRDSVLEIVMDTNTQAWRTFRQQFEDGKIGLSLEGGGARTVFVSDAISYNANGILTVRPGVLRPYTTYTATLAAKSALQTMLKQDAIPAADEGRFYHSWSFTTGAMPNTFPGTNVVVSSGGVTLTFANVSSNGDTVILADDSPPPAPAGFFAGDSSAYYDISTTAGYTPLVTICLPYDLLPDQDPNDARLFVYEDGAWHDITTTNDTANRIICGQATILSRFAVFRADRTPPVLTVPSDITAEATSSAGAAVTYSVTAADEVDPDPTVACNPASGSTFPLGPTTVTCTATDDAGNTSSGSFTVTILDAMPPVLVLPSDITAEAASSAGATVAYSATATDNMDPNPIVTCSPSSGSMFPLGATTVTCTATDAAGNTSTGSFTVTVVDTTPPVLTMPSNITVTVEGGEPQSVPITDTVEATSPDGVVIHYDATAWDGIDSDVTVTYSHPPGSTFPVGTTSVTVTATDAYGNVSTSSFTVTVADRTPPALTMPLSITPVPIEWSSGGGTEPPPSVPVTVPVEATSSAGAVVTYIVTATDKVDASPTVVCNPPSGSMFPIGTTTVNCTATDKYGNEATGSFTVTVVDRTAPELRIMYDITAEATSPDGTVGFFDVWATDAVDPYPTAICNPPSGSMFPLGTTTVTCTATDAAGNSVSGSFTVEVVPGAAATFTVSAPSTATAGVAFNIQLTAYDAYGNTDTGYEGVKTLSYSGPGTNPSGATPSYTTSVTFAGGISGMISITLVDAETTSLTVTDGTVTGTSGSITVLPGLPSANALVALPAVFKADGVSVSTLSGSIVDAYGNPVADGTAVALSLTGPGSLSASQVLTTNGQFSATYTAGTEAGIATVTATAGDTSMSVVITLTVTADTTAPGEVLNLSGRFYGKWTLWPNGQWGWNPATPYYQLWWTDPGDSDLAKIRVNQPCWWGCSSPLVEVAPGTQALTVPWFLGSYHVFRVQTIDTAGNVSVGRCIRIYAGDNATGVPVGC